MAYPAAGVGTKLVSTSRPKVLGDAAVNNRTRTLICFVTMTPYGVTSPSRALDLGLNAEFLAVATALCRRFVGAATNES
jgi:hypothetical protein